MAFLFSSSHLPASRVRRPELEDEDNDENREAMPRSGGVRASSHLRAEEGNARTTQSQMPDRLLKARPKDLRKQDTDGVAAAKASGVFDVVREQYNRSDSSHYMDEDGNLSPRDVTHMPDSPARDSLSPKVLAGLPPRPVWKVVNDGGFHQSRPPEPESNEGTRPWHMPSITPEDLHSLTLAADALESRPESRSPMYISNDRPQKSAPPAPSFPSARSAAETPVRSTTFPQSRLASHEKKSADTKQTLEAKPGRNDTDETPRGLEYALKFIGGTIGDMILNTAVGVFGGPGKHSYNPSPIRRAWHVDGVLPKIDRDAYNRLQDGAEMLAFSLGEASNPGNQIHLGIPLPSWQNRNAPFMSPQEAAQWFKEYHANVKKTGSGEFHIEMNKNLLSSKLVNGTLSFEVARPTEDGMMSGKDMFKAMMEFYGPAVKAIEGNWVDGSNLNRVNELTTGGTPLESAVKMTFTGLQAAAHGYTEVEITHLAGEKGHFSDIQVIFKKPGS